MDVAERHGFGNRTHQPKRAAMGYFGRGAYPEIKPHFPDTVNFLIRDVDRADAVDCWRGNISIPPNILTCDRRAGRGHLIWFLNLGIRRGNETAMQFLRDIAADLDHHLGGDRGYHGLVRVAP